MRIEQLIDKLINIAENKGNIRVVIGNDGYHPEANQDLVDFYDIELDEMVNDMENVQVTTKEGIINLQDGETILLIDSF